jgi:hypothetical protein
MSLNDIHELIKRDGKIRERDTERLRESLHGKRKKILSETKSDGVSKVFKVSDTSDDTTEGEERNFKQTIFKWKRAQKKLYF